MIRNIRVSTQASHYSQQNRDIMTRTRSYGPRRSLELAFQALLFGLPAVHILVRSVVLASKRHFRFCQKWNADWQRKSTLPTAEHSITQVPESSICALLLQNGDGSRASAGLIGKEALLVVVVDVNDSVPTRT